MGSRARHAESLSAFLLRLYLDSIPISILGKGIVD